MLLLFIALFVERLFIHLFVQCLIAAGAAMLLLFIGLFVERLFIHLSVCSMSYCCNVDDVYRFVCGAIVYTFVCLVVY